MEGLKKMVTEAFISMMARGEYFRYLNIDTQVKPGIPLAIICEASTLRVTTVKGITITSIYGRAGHGTGVIGFTA